LSAIGSRTRVMTAPIYYRLRGAANDRRIQHILSSSLRNNALLVPLSIAAASGVALGALFFAECFTFSDTFLILGSATSYFPWSWGTTYAFASAVQAAFYEGLEISLSVLFCSVLVLVLSLRSLKQNQHHWA
jgi:hypothetical protein